MKREDAEHIVIEAYALALERTPDDEGLNSYVTALLDGAQDGFEIVRSLLTSEEAALLRRKKEGHVGPDLAEKLLREIYSVTLSSEPDGSLVDAMRFNAEADGFSIVELVQFLMRQPGFSIGSKYSMAEAERVVTDAYLLVLGRAPDAEGIASHVEPLTSGSLDAHDILRTLLLSDEKAQRDAEQRLRITPDVAKQCLVPAFMGLLGREPEDEAVEALERRAEAEHVTVPELCAEIVASPEFAARARQLPAVAEYIAQQSQLGGASDELVLLIQEFIAIRLRERGCKWALPPIFPTGVAIPTAQVAGLIRTLTMLSDRQPATLPAR